MYKLLVSTYEERNGVYLCYTPDNFNERGSMAQRDWNEVLGIFDEKAPEYLDSFLASDERFAPSETLPNPFGEGGENFSAAQLGKPKPGNWIPVYKSEELPAWFHEHALMPIRAGKAEFFFYRGGIGEGNVLGYT